LRKWQELLACTQLGLNFGAGPSERSVSIGGVVLESLDEFVYLGSLQSGCMVSAADVRWHMGITAGCMKSFNTI